MQGESRQTKKCLFVDLQEWRSDPGLPSFPPPVEATHPQPAMTIRPQPEAPLYSDGR